MKDKKKMNLGVSSYSAGDNLLTEYMAENDEREWARVIYPIVEL